MLPGLKQLILNHADPVYEDISHGKPPIKHGCSRHRVAMLQYLVDKKSNGRPSVIYDLRDLAPIVQGISASVPEHIDYQFLDQGSEIGAVITAVSYTHLTLPTIYSV